MFGRNSKSKTILAALAIICLTSACALNTASSKLSYGDGLTVAEFPKRVGVATLVGNLTGQVEATDRLSRGLTDLGFQVVTRNWDVDKILRQSGAGTSENIPESTRRTLEETYGLQGIFVGTLSQDRGSVIDETRVSLKLIAVNTGKLVWSASVRGGGVAGLSPGVKEMAVAAVEKALRSLEKDLYFGSEVSSTPSLLQRSQSEK